MKLIIDPRDERWFRIGDVTRCNLCGLAVQLRVEPMRGIGKEVALWRHFITQAGYHPGEPKLSLWEAAHRRDVDAGILRE